MTYFISKSINTQDHLMVGTTWPFRGCEVEMHNGGFSCNCRKRLTYKCNHIKSVELGILGVGQTYYESVHS